jgi:hypothetical protein
MAKISGKGGTMTINSTPFKIAEWELSEEVNTPNVTDSGTTDPYTEFVAGRRQASFSCQGFVDTAAVPNSTVLPGTTISTVHLTVNGTIKYIVPTAIVQSLQVGTPIGSGEAVRFSCRAVVSGSYTTLA